jgi:hypothetical protein
MKITLNKYQQLMATAVQLGNIDISGPAATGKTHFAAHWAAEKVEMYKDHPDGADVVLQVENLRVGGYKLLGAFYGALSVGRESPIRQLQGRHYPYHQIGNVTVHLIRGDQWANLGPHNRPVFFVQDDVYSWEDGACQDLPTGWRGIRVIKTPWNEKEFCLDIKPADGGGLPKHNEL